jgi:hypothetical protein
MKLFGGKFGNTDMVLNNLGGKLANDVQGKWGKK